MFPKVKISSWSIYKTARRRSLILGYGEAVSRSRYLGTYILDASGPKEKTTLQEFVARKGIPTGEGNYVEGSFLEKYTVPVGGEYRQELLEAADGSQW